MKTKPLDPLINKSLHLSALHVNLSGMILPSEEIAMSVHLTASYLRQEYLKFQCCPECESKELQYYGYSSTGNQNYKCKYCSRVFVAQRDSIFPRTKRRNLYIKEFMKSKEEHNYWEPALNQTIAYLESHKGRLMINRIIKNSFDCIEDKKSFDALVYIVVRESYNIIMSR